MKTERESGEMLSPEMEMQDIKNEANRMAQKSPEPKAGLGLWVLTIAVAVCALVNVAYLAARHIGDLREVEIVRKECAHWEEEIKAYDMDKLP